MVSAPCVRFEIGAGIVERKSRFARDGGQHLAVADEASLEEVRAEEALDEIFGIAARPAPTRSSRCASRVLGWRSIALEREVDADRAARGADRS